jgi:hypothetical protein
MIAQLVGKHLQSTKLAQEVRVLIEKHHRTMKITTKT